jgi:hypothetical protein
MLGKKILASIFAVVILLKLIALATSPDKWLGLTGVFLGHSAILMVIYLVLLVMTGYYVLTSLDPVDVAVVMFFTSLLVGLSLIPYTAALLKLQEEIITVGLGKVWFVVAIWGIIAIGVLYRVFARKR